MGIFLPCAISGDAFRVYYLTCVQTKSHAILASLVVGRVIAVALMFVPAETSLWLMAPVPETGQGMSSDASGIISQKTLVLNRAVLNRPVSLKPALNRPA